MHRHFFGIVLGIIAFGLLAANPAIADDRQELEKLKEQVERLSAQLQSQLDEDVEQYLNEQSASAGAQGGGDNIWSRIKISARFVGLHQSTVGFDPSDAHAVDGVVDLHFDFTVTDNLDFFIHLTANTASEGDGDPLDDLPAPITGSGFESLLPGGVVTAGAITDGIGVNGLEPTDPGSITVYEAGIKHQLPMGDRWLHWELGTIKARERFAQNRFTDDHYTQFINNNFNDPASAAFISRSGGPTVFGIHMWTDFGQDGQFTLNWGWFNTPGLFFDQGQFWIQLTWAGKIGDRDATIRFYGFIDNFNEDMDGDDSAGGGFSWDWQLNERIGVFIKLGATGNDVNPVEFDAAFGAVITGLIESRPDDVLGIGVSILSLQEVPGTVFATIPDDTEITVELYYRYVTEEGKLHITPHLMLVSDPGGGIGTSADDTLFILGVRIYVPF